MAQVSEVSICRMALGWLGANSIVSLDDDSVEAALCKENYDFARDAVLEEGDWSFATVEARLTARADETPLLTDGKYFLLPADCIRVLGVYDTSAYPIDIWEKKQRNILTKADAIIIEYIKQETNPKVYSPTFVQALAARLAAILAPPITNSDSVADKFWGLYDQSVSVATTHDGLQGGDRPLGKSTLVNVRSNSSILGRR